MKLKLGNFKLGNFLLDIWIQAVWTWRLSPSPTHQIAIKHAEKINIEQGFCKNLNQLLLINQNE